METGRNLLIEIVELEKEKIGKLREAVEVEL
jgi:hypothetical protein